MLTHIKKRRLLVPRIVKREIVKTPSGVSHSFDVLSTKFELGLAMLLIYMSNCTGT